MNVVVAGLSPRDEAVFGVFLGRTLTNWAWQGAAGGRGVDLPKADLYVLDLVAFGLSHWSDAAQSDVLRLVQGAPAVLLVSANDRTWAAMDAGLMKRQGLVLVAKPYGSEDMRVALKEASAVAIQRAAQPVAAPRPVSAPRSAPIAPAPIAPPVSMPSAPPASSGRDTSTLGGLRPIPVPPPRPAKPAAAHPVPVHEDVPGLTAADLRARLDAQEDAARYVFLRKFSDMLSQPQPFEARFTVQNSVICHPVDGWVASNTPMLVIERVCSSDALASAVSMREVDVAQAEERAQRLGMPLRELDAFLWELVSATLDKKPRPPLPVKQG